jgi:hypothetical protein
MDLSPKAISATAEAIFTIGVNIYHMYGNVQTPFGNINYANSKLSISTTGAAETYFICRNSSDTYVSNVTGKLPELLWMVCRVEDYLNTQARKKSAYEGTISVYNYRNSVVYSGVKSRVYIVLCHSGDLYNCVVGPDGQLHESNEDYEVVPQESIVGWVVRSDLIDTIKDAVKTGG